MIDSMLISKLRELGIEYKCDEPMSRHTSFRIGGPAKMMFFPRNTEELKKLSEVLRRAEERPLVIGKGTNLLVTDEPLDKIVLQTGNMSDISESSGVITADCGVSLFKLAVYAKDRGLTGLEFAHGIPGSLGGAVYMNAGAYGGEMSQVIEATEYLDENLNVCTARGISNGFGYRKSVFENRDCVILKAVLKLEKGDPAEIESKMAELNQKRRTSQPLEKASAGSTFKRPDVGYAAALIQDAGLKGFAIGGAQVSDKHSGFVINNGGATFDDILRVMDHVRETVKAKFGIELEPEVRIIRN